MSTRKRATRAQSEPLRLTESLELVRAGADSALASHAFKQEGPFPEVDDLIEGGIDGRRQRSRTQYLFHLAYLLVVYVQRCLGQKRYLLR